MERMQEKERRGTVLLRAGSDKPEDLERIFFFKLLKDRRQRDNPFLPEFVACSFD